MNRTDKDPQEPNNAFEAFDPAGRRPWVKPTLERLSLKDALTVCSAPGHDLSTGS
jgi:hypothetical protein